MQDAPEIDSGAPQSPSTAVIRITTILCIGSLLTPREPYVEVAQSRELHGAVHLFSRLTELALKRFAKNMQ